MAREAEEREMKRQERLKELEMIEVFIHIYLFVICSQNLKGDWYRKGDMPPVFSPSSIKLAFLHWNWEWSAIKLKCERSRRKRD